MAFNFYMITTFAPSITQKRHQFIYFSSAMWKFSTFICFYYFQLQSFALFSGKTDETAAMSVYQRVSQA